MTGMHRSVDLCSELLQTTGRFTLWEHRLDEEKERLLFVLRWEAKERSLREIGRREEA